MTFAQRSRGESRHGTSECLKEGVRPMVLHWANVRSTSARIRRGGELCSRPALHGQRSWLSYTFCSAITSISTPIPSGRFAASIVVLAGGSLVKKVA